MPDTAAPPALPAAVAPPIPAPASRPTAIRPNTTHIPGWVNQPEPAVRAAYWWALPLIERGWLLRACGERIARRGFIAEIPIASEEILLVIYPGDTTDDTAAGALARHFKQLGAQQRRQAQRVIAFVAERRAQRRR
ncbi:MAG: hypothetical protein PHQ28_02920 [Mycobacterium sp.]|nr:hypothetical protein [Mycobacterium sp.]